MKFTFGALSRRPSILATAGLLFLAAGNINAAVITITFDAGDPIGGLAAGSTLSNQYSASGVTFSPNAFSGAGGPNGNWATNTNMTIVDSAGVDVGGLGTPSLVSGNLLRSFNGWLGENGDGSFLATFSTPIDSISADFAGIATAGSVRLFAYNGVNLLGTATAGATGQQTLSLSGLGPITSVAFTPGDFFDWVGVDNITFNTIGVAEVPEPSTISYLAIAGAALLLSRKRR